MTQEIRNLRPPPGGGVLHRLALGGVVKHGDGRVAAPGLDLRQSLRTHRVRCDDEEVLFL